MAYVSGSLTSLGMANGFTLYHHDAGTDGVADVQASGYFNTSTDEPMRAGDEIISVCADGNATLQVSSVATDGAVTTKVKDAVGNVETGSTAANLSAVGTSLLGNTTAVTFTLDLPFKGAYKELVSIGATLTQTVNIGDTVATFDGTNRNLTFDAAGEAVILRGSSSTRWVIVSNEGSVGTS